MTYTGGGGKGQRKGTEPPPALLTLNSASGMIISFFVVIKEKSPHDRGNGLSYPRGSRGFPPPQDTIGARGIFISLCCVAGSLIGARLLEPIMNRHVGRYAVSRTAKDEGAAQ